MTAIPRYTSSEDRRDILDALATKLDARVVTVEPYTAVGSTSAKIALQADKLPLAVVLVGAQLYYDISAPVTLTPNHNFVWDSGTKTAQVYEPATLTANTVYRLTYLVIGG
jgi:hypothetical protein